MITKEQEKALDRLIPIYVQAIKTGLIIIALIKFLDTRGAVDKKKVGTGAITK